MHNLRKRYDAVFKAKVALEATKGEKTIAQLSSEIKHPAPRAQGMRLQEP